MSDFTNHHFAVVQFLKMSNLLKNNHSSNIYFPRLMAQVVLYKPETASFSFFFSVERSRRKSIIPMTADVSITKQSVRDNQSGSDKSLCFD